MPDYVRRMRREDTDQVLEIDREAFPTEWPPPNFRRELDNRLAYYIVTCRAEELVEETLRPDPPERGHAGIIKGVAGIISHAKEVFGGDGPPEIEHSARGEEFIIGFAGFWVMADEAHITSIATRTAHQRQGIGELMLQSVIDLAARMKARMVTLEVRVSNTAAQGLYTKYGFSQVGVRRGYYSDNREDALVMSTDGINSAGFQAHIRELTQAYQTRWGADRYQLRH